MINDTSLHDIDPELWEAVHAEELRQEAHLELIASENYASPAIMALMGSVLTNKYAEGYPGKRYYGGCEHVDVVEQLAIDRLKALFNADYANVQPHSGSQANAAVMMALLQPGDSILGQDLSQGGHLTHGAKVSFSGKVFHSAAYGLTADGDIDYEQVEVLAKEHRPKLLVTGFSAFSGVIDWQRLRDIADSVDAYMLADIAHVAGLVAVGLYPSPVGIADVVTSTTHKTLRGPRGGIIMARANPDIEKRLNSAVFPGTQGGPAMHAIGGKALAFLEAAQPAFKTYQQQVINNAKAMADVLQQRGFAVIGGGTNNHLVLLDLTQQNVTGKAAEQALEAAFITTNKNTVPGEKRSPFVTSGIRIGTPAMTTRGMKEAEAKQVASWIADVIDHIEDETVVMRVRQSVKALCERFPVYQHANETAKG